MLVQNYPFVDPSDDIRGKILDLHLTFDDVMGIYTAPFSVTYFSRAPNGLYSIIIQDSANNTVFDSSDYSYSPSSYYIPGTTSIEQYQNIGHHLMSCRYKKKSWGPNHVIITWETPFIHLIVYAPSDSSDFTIAVINGELDVNSLANNSVRVRKLWVGSEEIAYTPIVISEGFNMELEQNENEITLNAVAGAGDGKVPRDCQDTHMAVKRVNGAIPDANGNIYLTADMCHSIMHTAPNNLSLINDCTPCCKCEDMSTVGNYIQRLGEDYYKLGAASEDIRDRTQEVIDAYSEIQEDSAPTLDPFTVDITPAGCPFLWVKVMFKNVTPTIVTRLSCMLLFTGEIDVVSGTTRAVLINGVNWSEEPESDAFTGVQLSHNGAHTYAITWGDTYIRPNEYVYAYFKVKLVRDPDYSATLGVRVSDATLLHENQTIEESIYTNQSDSSSTGCPVSYADYTTDEYADISVLKNNIYEKCNEMHN